MCSFFACLEWEEIFPGLKTGEGVALEIFDKGLDVEVSQKEIRPMLCKGNR